MSIIDQILAWFLGNGNEEKEHVQGNPRLEETAREFLLSFPGMQKSLSWVYSSRIIDPLEQIYEDVSEYIRNGQVHHYGVQLVQLVRVVRDGQIDFEHDPTARSRFRMLLWHGTMKDNIAPILTNGFNLPKKPGLMFGPGVYFADRVSKSCNYGDKQLNRKDGYLFLCDVLLGKMYNAKEAHNEYTEAPSGFKKDFDSVMCTGRKIPDRDANRKTFGSIIPCGPTIQNKKFEKYALDYNEYIVYDTNKIRIKYVVHVKFETNKVS